MLREIKKGIVLTLIFIFAGSTAVMAARPTDAKASKEEWEVLRIANRERYAEGIESVSTFSSIQSACGVRAKEISTSFSHTRPSGESCFSALSEKKIEYYSAGENIAAGHSDPEEVMKGWMNSTGHRANILRSGYKHMGVGYYYVEDSRYRKHWVQLFVGGCTTTGITVKGIEASYDKGTSMDDTGIYLEVTCDMHGISYVPVNKEMCSNYSLKSVGTQTVTVKYQGCTSEFTVEVKGKGDEGQDKESESGLKKPAKVKKLTVAKLSGKKVKITWGQVKADGYEIYMKKGNKAYTKIKTIKKNTTCSYIKAKLKKKTKYTFKVRAFNKNATGVKYGKYSGEKKIKL